MNFKNELNDKQFEAVTSDYKYNRIIAGAGSGKTRVLTYRLAYLLEKEEIPSYRLLAITFTNKVAKEMKERTIKLLPNLDLHDLLIMTFHSFAAWFLRHEINSINFPRNFVILDEDDQKMIVKNIAISHGLSKGDDLVDESLKYIASKKCKGILPDQINVFGKDSKEAKCLEFYEEYESIKNKQYALDFDDLLIYSCLILKNFPEIRKKYNARFYEVLVDEFQDTNDLQYDFLKLLTGNDSGLFVVGDPDQTIYTWRGANNKIILDVDKYFGGLNTIILNENYRSTDKILSKANLLIDKNKERIKKDLITNIKSEKEVTLKSCYSVEEEANFVIKKIVENKIKNNSKYSDFAILYRSAYLSRSFEKALMNNRIPYAVYSGTKFYERREIKDILAYFRLFINEYDDVAFQRIINVPKRKIGEVFTKKLIEEATKEKLSLYLYMKNIDKYDTYLSLAGVSKLKEMIRLIEKYKVQVNDKANSFSEVLERFIRELGYYEYLAEDEDSEDRIDNVRALIDDLRSYLKANPEGSLDEYLQNVSLMTSQDEIKDNDRVALMTVHTAKGLEFNTVFVVGFNEGVFPNQRSLNEGKNEALEEERRLAYVAFTRAKEELIVTYSYSYSYINKAEGTLSRFAKEAGLKETSIVKKENHAVYSYDFEKKKMSVGRNDEVNEVSFTNDYSRKAGDKLTHQVFGEGEVLKVEGDIIVVNFKSFGEKKMLGNHHMLKKKE